MRSYISACLLYLPKAEELPLQWHLPPPPLPAGERWASANGFARPSPERIHTASNGSGRPLSSPSPLLTTVFHGPASRFTPVDLTDVAPMPQQGCVAPRLWAPGQGGLVGGSRRFSRGKQIQKALWEENQVQIYICDLKLRTRGNSKHCKRNICRVRMLQDS